MALLSEEIKKEVQIELQGLKNEVKLIVFTQEIECEYCNENRLLAEEIASLSDKIKVEVYNFTLDKNKVEEYKIDKIPAIAVCDETGKDYGIPAGYEFTSLMEAMRMVSSGESGLLEESKKELQKLNKPMHIQVFVTLT
ncbi:MAG: thioredoxin family protein [candidate division Zixibacteria bacterium]|nr:thioredoxin family protein [candidate division Zixibacteria bacterium]